MKSAADMFGVGDFSSNFISGIAGNAGSFIIGETGTCSDLKQMLESNRDDVKLEAMKCITTMTAKGRLSMPKNLFPSIVKNVSSKNAELRKLVYLYLSNFADQEPDMALLSIASIQKSLKNPNPLVRSSALRALTSIRLNILSAIFMATIKDSVNDLNPYVRKTVAHSIIKVYRLDSSLKDSLVDHIQRLLSDKNSCVISSAVSAFEVVCPERLDLLQRHFKRYCAILADISEWGQVAMLNILMRYARRQFSDPNSVRKADQSPSEEITPITIDPDHLLLLRSAKPLLQSQNSAVVLGVIQLYLAVAPHNEIRSVIVKPIIRLLHSHREIKLIIFDLVANLTSKISTPSGDEPGKENVIKNIVEDEKKQNQDREQNEQEENEDRAYKLFPYRDMFQPHIKYFLVRPTDCTQVRIVKLKILTNLCNSVNVALVLRELQAYIMHFVDDTEFVSYCVQTIGTCATLVKEVSHQCLNGLTSLLSNREETIVSEAIVVLRSQIIGKTDYESESSTTTVIRQVTRLFPTISAPQARATILWILAEFCGRNRLAARCAPNVLRQVAKSFCDEKDIVKLQALNLTAKLNLFIKLNSDLKDDKLKNHGDSIKKLSLLTSYIFSLAKYDQNYDVRDRGRFLKKLISDTELARQVLSQDSDHLNHQASPQHNCNRHTFVKRTCNVGLIAGETGQEEFIPGSLSYFVNHQVDGYQPLGPFAEYVEPATFAKTDVEDDDDLEDDFDGHDLGADVEDEDVEYEEEEIEEEVEVEEDEDLEESEHSGIDEDLRPAPIDDNILISDDEIEQVKIFDLIENQSLNQIENSENDAKKISETRKKSVEEKKDIPENENYGDERKSNSSSGSVDASPHLNVDNNKNQL